MLNIRYRRRCQTICALEPCSGGNDAIWSGEEVVPGIAAGVHDGVVVAERAVAQLAAAQPGPDVPNRVQFRTVGRQVQQGQIAGTRSSPPGWCQPAPSRTTTACAPGAARALISARCRFMMAVLADGSTGLASIPRAGRTAPNR